MVTFVLLAAILFWVVILIIEIMKLQDKVEHLKEQKERLKESYAYECMRYSCCSRTLVETMKEAGIPLIELRGRLNNTRVQHEDREVDQMRHILDRQYPEV